MSDIDIRRIDFGLLLVFRELLRTRRTTLAARRLGVSQSAISHALARLRDIFGDDLFLRHSNGLEPTQAAVALDAKIEAILAAAEAALGQAEAFDPRGSDRVFRVVANDYLASLLIPRLRARLAAEAPGVRLCTRFAVGAAAIEAVRRDDVDLALGRFGSLPAELEMRRLGAETYLVAGRRDHRVFRRAFTIDSYLAAEHVLVSFRGDLHGTADTALARIGRERRVALSVPMFLTAFALVAQGDALVTAPARLLRGFAATFGLAVRPPPFPIEPFDVVAISRERKQPQPERCWFLDQVLAAWREVAGEGLSPRRLVRGH